MNKMDLRFSAKISNEPFARTTIAAFVTTLNPTIDEVLELKTILAEAVSNAIIHGYNYDESKYVYIKATIINEKELEIIVQDYGVGIEDVEKARTPAFTSRPDQERSGMGFTIIESLSDDFQIQSIVSLGTKLTIKKTFSSITTGVK